MHRPLVLAFFYAYLVGIEKGESQNQCKTDELGTPENFLQ